MPDHPNPAEHCKAIGAGVGDTIRCSAGEFLITYIGANYIHGEWPGGVPGTLRRDSDITAWTKAEPPPTVTIDDYDNGLCRVNHGGRETFKVAGHGNARDIFGWNRSAKLCRIGAEAIKSAIEADLGKAADAAVRYTTERLGDSVVVREDGTTIGYFNATVPGSNGLHRIIDAGIAALNADAEPVADGPYTLHVEEADSDDPDDCLASFEIHGPARGGSVNYCSLGDPDGDPIPGLTVAESNALIGKHLGNLVAELNARQPK